jgi:2-polyprenyl-3-methyl-5-hydroxy-6-metoxy-1,4-benzoquinol methylase
VGVNPEEDAMRRRKEWFDTDSFWRDTYAFQFSQERIDGAVGEMDRAISLIKPAGNTVLDLCCGPGRCSVALAQKGFSVTGVDRTRFLLAKARSRAKQAGVTIEWVRADMRDFVRRSGFDVVLSMFTSFGYFDDKKEDAKVLRNMFASLRRGGACLIDVMGKERLARILDRRAAVSCRMARGW